MEHVKKWPNDITEWEDYDDDVHRTNQPFEPIGFQHTLNSEAGNWSDMENEIFIVNDSQPQIG